MMPRPVRDGILVEKILLRNTMFFWKHNNFSENVIRNVKVKTKVSGQFRNDKGKGADRYARIRAIVDTNIKNGQDDL